MSKSQQKQGFTRQIDLSYIHYPYGIKIAYYLSKEK